MNKFIIKWKTLDGFYDLYCGKKIYYHGFYPYCQKHYSYFCDHFL